MVLIPELKNKPSTRIHNIGCTSTWFVDEVYQLQVQKKIEVEFLQQFSNPLNSMESIEFNDRSSTTVILNISL